MSFIHPLLLGGLLLAALPVVLHLILRQQPKQVAFPAFRFLVRKATTNRRKLQLRHWLLLLMRILLLALMCLSLARPRLFSDRFNFAGDAPVAAVLVIDTSASMGYTIAGKTRLDDAKARALELIDGFPAESRVAVLDPSELGGEWQASLASARDRIGTRELRAAAGPLTDSVSTAYRLFAELARDTDQEPPPRFIYLITDRTPASWDVSRHADLIAGRDKIVGPPIRHAIIDLGTDKPADLALAEVKLKPQVIPANRPVTIPVTVQSLGLEIDTQLQMRIVGKPEGEPRALQLSPGKVKEVVFRRGGLKPGLYQADISPATTDALPADDSQFVTFEVREPRPVLIICDRIEDAEPLLRALKSNYATEVKTAGDPALAGDLSKYRAICLVSVAAPKPELWNNLETYVTAGGGLALFPGGDELDRTAYRHRLVPAQFATLIDAPSEGQVWIEYQYQHPLIAPFRDDAQNSETGYAENPPRTYRYWEVTPTGTVLLRYGDDRRRPAIVETAFDPAKVRGRVVMFTTPFDDRRDARDRSWNDYNQWWLYLVLTNRTLQYLGGAADDAEYNHVAGPPVRVVLPAGMKAASFNLVGPGLSAADTTVVRPEKATELRIPQARSAGHYTLTAVDRSWATSFSVNAPASEFQLVPRVPIETLTEICGPDAVLAPGQTSLQEKLASQFRQPLELFPWLMLVLLLLFVVENYFANRFYGRGAEPTPGVTKQ